jgi:hypothetical protein
MKMKHISKLIAIIGLLLVGMPKANAQQVTVDAKIDSLQLLIGEQAKVTLEVSLDANQKLQLPMLWPRFVKKHIILTIGTPFAKNVIPPKLASTPFVAAPSSVNTRLFSQDAMKSFL